MLDTAGYELFRSVFPRDEMAALTSRLPTIERAGARSLLDHPDVLTLARDPRLRALVGDRFAVRGLLFDKTPAANWGVRWHQDLAVAVTERRDAAGFDSWTMKHGVPHALAPAAVLETMVTLRVHLDDCGADVGPLQVIAGSHRNGRFDADALPSTEDAVSCLAAAGDVLAFKPLLLHASASSTSDQHRRVLQLEFADFELPNGLTWRWQIASGNFSSAPGF